MIDRFRRRPNDRDRQALEHLLAKEKQYRRDEIISSSVGLVVLLVASMVLMFVLRIDDLWFPRRPTFWISLGESFAFFAVTAIIGVVFGLPNRFERGRTRYFDRDTLREARKSIDKLETALEGEVRVLRCDATAVIAFGDDDDDVDAYAFQASPDRMLFVEGFVEGWVAEGDNFPNTSFEVVTILEDGDYVAVHCLGKPLKARRLLPTAALPDAVDGEASGRLEDLVAVTV